jgi:poly-gamma-glutamate capsule biosynthesis protein CapA/YwtB (metallophosphatase superfamily)
VLVVICCDQDPRILVLAVAAQPGSLSVKATTATFNPRCWKHPAGTNYIQISLAEESLKVVKESIIKSRTTGADVVIFSIHWGPNMAERPSPLFREFAHAVMDAGADVFHGHSAHVFQGIEMHRGKPIIYDSGDFVDDYSVDPVLRNDRGLIFRLLVEEKQVKHLDCFPSLFPSVR